MGIRPHRKYTIAGKRWEDALRVHRDAQLQALRVENQHLKSEIAELKEELRAADELLGVKPR